jgi:aryl-alcohol dehydrogenase-like predicted oxidoreductase
MTVLGSTDLDVFPVCLGGTVFGWTADRAASFAVLDAYAAAGGNFIDTADMYSSWVPGHVGGESESVIGQWMSDRGNRDSMIVATKVGKLPGLTGLSAATIRTALEGSLRRLQTDRIDLFYIHVDDPATPLEETLGALDAAVREGTVRHIAASNISPDRLAASLDVSAREGLASYVAVQEEYNLVAREPFESGMLPLLQERGLSNVPYTALAKGFLTGKYRPGAAVDSHRAADNEKLLDERGLAVLAALDTVADAHRTTVAAVALAWLADRPGVTSPIASARRVDQLADLLPMAGLHLTDDERQLLDGVPAGVR